MLTPKECAAVLGKLYDDAFDGEEHGAFRIARQDMVNVTGRPVFHQTIIEDVADWLVDLGLIMVDRDDHYILLRHTYFDNIRKVTPEMVEKYAEPVNFGGPYSN